MSNEYLTARSRYVNLIKKELLGPGSEIELPDAEHELISTAPEKRYSMGILFPKDKKMNADNDDSSKVEEDASDDIDDDNEIENGVAVEKNADELINYGSVSDYDIMTYEDSVYMEMEEQKNEK